MSRFTDADERYEAIIDAIAQRADRAFKKHGHDDSRFKRLRDRLIRLDGDDDALTYQSDRLWDWVKRNRKFEDGCCCCGESVDWSDDYEDGEYQCHECTSKAHLDRAHVMSWN